MLSPSSSATGYLICATPRTGSTLLCGLLRSTGVAGRPESYFRAEDEEWYAEEWRLPREGGRGYRDYLRAAVTAGSTGNGVFAARVMWGTAGELTRRIRATEPGHTGSEAELLDVVFGPLRYVHLERRDTVAQAVSWVRAEQTGFWQDGEERRPGGEPGFDPERMSATVLTIEEHNGAWRHWFAAQGIRPHTVHYEELVADVNGVTRGILDFLGLRLPPTHEITPGHRRQADEINRDWIARYRSMSQLPGGAPVRP